MTDKQPPSLNLIERMAQRMAKQDGAAVRTEPTSSPMPAAKSAPVMDAANGRAAPLVEDIRRAPEPVVLRAETPAPVREPVQAAAPVRSEPAGEKSREVHLDFRVLRQNGMITPDNMASVISNEFRGIKRKLLQKARDQETRAVVNNLVMVTSSLPGEGKTFTSLNLAISLAAERGLQVLLVDADVVRPSVGNVFKSTPKEGLTDLLSGKSTRVSDVMCRTAELPNLSVIFSGSARVDSPELISSGRMVDLCNDLSKRYPDRMIIIDTPPVLASPEPATLAAYVHQLIMVVAAEQTSRPQLQKSLESVASCRNVSLLFNKAPKWNELEYKSYYGYGYSGTNNAPAASA